MARGCGCCLMTTGPAIVAGGGVTVRRRSGWAAVTEYSPACSVCIFEITNTLLVSSGNTTPFRRHWMMKGGGKVVEKVKASEEPGGTVWFAGEMEATVSVTARNCFT